MRTVRQNKATGKFGRNTGCQGVPMEFNGRAPGIDSIEHSPNGTGTTVTTIPAVYRASAGTRSAEIRDVPVARANVVLISREARKLIPASRVNGSATPFTWRSLSKGAFSSKCTGTSNWAQANKGNRIENRTTAEGSNLSGGCVGIVKRKQVHLRFERSITRSFAVGELLPASKVRLPRKSYHFSRVLRSKHRTYPSWPWGENSEIEAQRIRHGAMMTCWE